MTVTNFIWDELSDNVLLETDENDVVTASYTNRPERFGELISQERSGVTSYFHYDGEHSTRNLTDSNEDVTDTFIYNAFGEEVVRTGTTTNPFGYKGAVGYYTNEDTNDLYVRRRTYLPTIGRWLSPDPLGFIDGSNLYQAYFVPNGVDPSGELTISWDKRSNWPMDPEISGCGKIFTTHHNWDTTVTELWDQGRLETCYWVQHVSYSCVDGECTDCGCDLETVETSQTEFLEFFPLENGEPVGATFNHRFDLKAFGASCGHYHWFATVKVFCGRSINRRYEGTDPAGDFEIDGCKGGISIGRHIFLEKNRGGDDYVLPPWWSGRSADGPESFDFSLDWRCCPRGKNYTDPKAVPGPDENPPDG